MSEIDVREFEERLSGAPCSSDLRAIVAVLRGLAEQASPGEWSIRAHAAPGRSWGLTYKRGRRSFCSFDVKPFANHVCVCMADATEAELKEAGLVHVRKNARPWVDVKDVRGAKALEPLIRRAYAAAGGQLKRQMRTA